MEAFIDQLWAWFLAGWALFTSPGSARAHALGLIACLLGASLYSARIGIRMVRNERQATIKAWNRKRQGHPPGTIPALSRKIAAVISIYLTGLLGSLKGVIVSLACGVMLPAVVLFVMVFAYPWFDSSNAHLVDSMGRPVDSVDPLAALLFVADQTLRGGLFDLIEIFAIDVTQITNNPANYPFSISLFLYHLYVEAFVFTGIVLFGHNAWVLGRQLIEEIRHHRKRHKTWTAGQDQQQPPIEAQATSQSPSDAAAPAGSAT